MPSNQANLSEALVEKYDCTGPRYTSYPTAPVWSDAFQETHWHAALKEANRQKDETLALYVHLPFCAKRCLFCACNVVISSRDDVLQDYLARLEKEIEQVAEHLPDRRKVSGIHWGGGTPTHLPPAELERVWSKLNDMFDIQPNAELSIEVHPPVTTDLQLETLARLGFRRMSLGVQDLDSGVQDLIYRHQTVEQTEHVLTKARELGFNSVNFDLIYGLPGQTMDTWNFTLDEVLRMRPDRLAIYSYAHVPWLHPHQEQMPGDQMPASELKIELLRTAARRLQEEGGYSEIGFDHFALPEDEMAIAVGEHRLYRNFMGYTVKPASDYVGFGMSAISEVGHAFMQNHTKLNRWNASLDEGRSAVSKGHALDLDDQVRKIVIERLMCNQRIAYAEVESMSGRVFQEHFAEAWEALAEMESDGLVIRGEEELVVTDLGRHFLRNVCMLFDRYLEQQLKQGRYSRTI
ncbi:MAG: oxygen-independent coproporphyrinogen III oxidase [Arenicella sp.]|nr:oxygen-independent coproporphyrinogen III oxidase [Arenicella sp.]